MTRVEAAGGELTIESAPGKGTVITGWIPLMPADDGERRRRVSGTGRCGPSLLELIWPEL